jgi:hypothetical protein
MHSRIATSKNTATVDDGVLQTFELHMIFSYAFDFAGVGSRIKTYYEVGSHPFLHWPRNYRGWNPGRKTMLG